MGSARAVAGEVQSGDGWCRARLQQRRAGMSGDSWQVMQQAGRLWVAPFVH